MGKLGEDMAKEVWERTLTEKLESPRERLARFFASRMHFMRELSYGGAGRESSAFECPMCGSVVKYGRKHFKLASDGQLVYCDVGFDEDQEKVVRDAS